MDIALKPVRRACEVDEMARCNVFHNERGVVIG